MQIFHNRRKSRTIVQAPFLVHSETKARVVRCVTTYNIALTICYDAYRERLRMRTLLQKVVVWNPYDREFVGNVIFQRGRYFFNTVEHCRRRGNTIPRKKRRPEGSCTQNGTVVSYDVPRVVARGAVGHTQQPETPASSTRGHPMLPHCLVPSYECNP